MDVDAKVATTLSIVSSAGAATKRTRFKFGFVMTAVSFVDAGLNRRLEKPGQVKILNVIERA